MQYLDQILEKLNFAPMDNKQKVLLKKIYTEMVKEEKETISKKIKTFLIEMDEALLMVNNGGIDIGNYQEFLSKNDQASEQIKKLLRDSENIKNFPDEGE